MLQLLKANPTPFSPSTGPAVLTKKSSTVANSKSGSERDYWTQLQLAIGDSQHFLDLINNLKWEDGLSQDSIDLIESKLSTNYNNDNSNNDGDSSQPPLVPTSSSLISVSMARHASESVSVLCEFAVSIVQYQYSFEPHNNAVNRVEKIKKDIEG